MVIKIICIIIVVYLLGFIGTLIVSKIGKQISSFNKRKEETRTGIIMAKHKEYEPLNKKQNVIWNNSLGCWEEK